MTARMDKRFADLTAEGRPALVTYFMGGDPDFETSLAIMKALPSAGADIIELGMPFSDPMADGPAIQLAGQRALKGGQTLAKTLEIARRFREDDQDTPIVMMGYYNPIYIYGVERFLDDALAAGIDGLIVVDLPPEMDDELCIPALKKDINFIRLATPTTDDKRLPKVLENTSGFVYYVSMNGITGSALPDPSRCRRCRAADQGPYETAGLRRLRRQDGRACARHRRVGRWRRRRHRHRQPGGVQPDRGRQDRQGRRCRAWKRWFAALSAGVRSAEACRGRINCPHCGARPVLNIQEFGFELDHELRSPEDQLDARPPGSSGKSLDQVPGNRRDGVSPRSRRQQMGHSRLRLPYEDAGQGAVEGPVRRRRLRSPAAAEGGAGPAEVPRFEEICRSPARQPRSRPISKTRSLPVSAACRGVKLVGVVHEFNFMGGSLGIAAGEAIIKAFEKAIAEKCPLVMFPASGGARMQEGILSLMQLPRTTVAVQMLKEAGLPYIVVLTNPTTGGVTASYAMLGDLHLAEPGAEICFAGKRVIEQTIREKLPEGFQTSEYLMEHGMVDMVVKRHDIPDTLARVLKILMKKPVECRQAQWKRRCSCRWPPAPEPMRWPSA